MYGGVGLWLHKFVISATDGGVWLAPRPVWFTTGEKAHGNHWIEGWMRPRAGLASVVKAEISCPLVAIDPQFSGLPFRNVVTKLTVQQLMSYEEGDKEIDCPWDVLQ
jgi:hypothetical protein